METAGYNFNMVKKVVLELYKIIISIINFFEEVFFLIEDGNT